MNERTSARTVSRLVLALLALAAMAACNRRSGTSTPTSSSTFKGETCGSLPIRMGGAQSFIGCKDDPPSQLDFPECYEYWFDLVEGQEASCPPTELMLRVSGWPSVLDEYQVRLVPEQQSGVVALVLTGVPGGRSGPRGPAPGRAGDVLAYVEVANERFVRFRPTTIVRSYRPNVSLERSGQ